MNRGGDASSRTPDGNPPHASPETSGAPAETAATPPETSTKAHADGDNLRAQACCASEPECILCPLRPENVHRSLQELWEAGLYANLPKLGFR